MSFPQYPEYKDSGVEWLGEVPAQWDFAPLWTLYRREKRTGFSTEKLLSIYRDYGVIPKESRDDNFNKPSDDLGSYQLVCEGDLAINKMKAWQGSVAVSGVKGIVSPAYHVYIKQHNCCDRYLHHLFRSQQYIAGYLSNSKGIRVNQWDLEPQQHSRMPVVLPPIDEQKIIASFLDHETARIDSLVEEQQRLTELLKEKRQAVISHAVTKGLDPDVPKRDSGVEWLGEVPAHWEALPLKYLVREPLKYGANEAASDNNSDHPRFVRITDVSADGTLRDETFRSLPPDVAKQYLLEEGDILFARSGATVGKSFLYKRSWGECCFAGYLIRARIDFRMALPEFVYFSFQSHGYWQYIGQQQIQATIQNVSAERYDSYVLPTPPVDEQARIVEHLNQHLGGYSELLETAEQSVSLLQERRSALISAAVTGKIDVRGWQPPAGSPALFEATQTEAV